MPDIFDSLDIFDHIAASTPQSPTISQTLAPIQQSNAEIADMVSGQEIQWRQQGAKLVPMPQADGTTEYVKVYETGPQPKVTLPDKVRIMNAGREEFFGTPLNRSADPSLDPNLEMMIRAGRANEPTTVMENFGGALGSGLGRKGAGLYGLASPDVGAAMLDTVQRGYEFDPESKAAFAGSAAANILPMLPAMVAGPAAAPLISQITAGTLGLSQFGNVRNEVSQRRANGEDISWEQEFGAAALSALAEYGGERIGLNALLSNKPYFVNKIAQRVMEYAIAGGVNMAEEAATQIAQNAVDGYILNNQQHQGQGVLEGVGEAAALGGVIGVGARGIHGLANRKFVNSTVTGPKGVLPPEFAGATFENGPTEGDPATLARLAVEQGKNGEAVAADARRAAAEPVTPTRTELPDLPDGLTNKELVAWGAANGYDVSGLEGKGKRIVRDTFASQKLATAARDVMTANKEAVRQAKVEQKQLPEQGHTWDAGQLRRFARENGYTIDERRVQIEQDRGTKPRDAVRMQIEEQYALPKGEGTVGEIPKVSPQPLSVESTTESGTTEARSTPPGLPKPPREARAWSFGKLKEWAKAAGYKVGSAENFDGLYRKIGRQRADSLIPDKPTMPASARNWTFKQMRYWAEQNGYNTEGVTGTLTLRKAIKEQRAAALKAARGTTTAAAPAETARLQAELEQERKLRRTDELTGAKNLVAYREESAAALKDADAKGEHVAIAESDLGNFKVANDELGHDVGDKLLRAEAEALQEGLRSEAKGKRPADLAGMHGYRTGGDEFPAILRGIKDEATAQRVLKRASEIFDQKAASIIGDRLPKEAYPFMSWGVEIRKPGDTRTIEQLRKAADAKVIPEKNRIKSERGVPQTREELKQYIDNLKRQTSKLAAATNAVIQTKVTPIEGTGHPRRLPTKLEEYLTPIASRIRDISPRIYDRLMQMEFNTGVTRENEKRLLTPVAERLTEALGGPKSAKYKNFKVAVFNGHFGAAKALLPDSSHGDFEHIVDMFDRLHLVQKAAGAKIGKLDSYWARYLKDYKAFDAIYGDDKGRFEDAFDLARRVKGKAFLTAEEKADIANDVVQGYGPQKPGSFGPANVRERRIEQITFDQADHYIDPFAAAMRYIDGATYAAERSRFLGRNHTGDNLMDTVGGIVQGEVDAGRLNKDAQEELTHLLHTRFTADMLTMSKNVRMAKQLMYLASLGQFRSALNQITDVAATAASHGLSSAIEGIKAAAGITSSERRILMEEVGQHSHGEEFKDVGKIAQLTDKALRATGFSRIDRFGKEARINAAWDAFTRAAKNPQSAEFSRLKAEWTPVLGDRLDATMQDFRDGRRTDLTKYMLAVDLLKVQPLTLSNMPEKYLSMRNGRILYAMKTFTLNQLDFIRRDMIRKLATSGQRKEGLKTLAMFAVLTTLIGAGKDLVNDLIRGKTVNADQIPDRSVEALISSFGLSRYSTNDAWTRGPAKAAMNFIVPPTAWIDATWNDVKSFGDGSGIRSLKYVPFAGEPLYYWFGKGAELNEKEAKADARGKLTKLRKEAIKAYQSGDMGTARDLVTIYNDRRREGADDGRKTPLNLSDLSHPDSNEQ
jgi:diguanylate cyclase (GGDEF)-like protein